MPVFNQDFVPGFNALYSAMIDRVHKTSIRANVYQSPFSQMVQDMECGRYVVEQHINPGHVLLQNTVTNTDIFTNYTDDIAVSTYDINVDLAFPSTYTEYVVRPAYSIIENVTELIASLTANIRTTLEYKRNELVKQMLYNGYQFGMLSSVKISDPRLDREASGKFAVVLNTLIDDFRTEINPRNVIYNNQLGITPEQYRKTISTEIPYVITFNEFVRTTEFMNALHLTFGERFASGNGNQDWQRRLMQLNFEDFPTSIPPLNRSEVTGQNVSAEGVNFYEMPVDKNGKPKFSNQPTGGDTICGFIIDPRAIKLYTQLNIKTSWLNPGTLQNTNREILQMIMELGAFDKICAITCDSGKRIPEDEKELARRLELPEVV